MLNINVALSFVGELRNNFKNLPYIHIWGKKKKPQRQVFPKSYVFDLTLFQY